MNIIAVFLPLVDDCQCDPSLDPRLELNATVGVVVCCYCQWCVHLMQVLSSGKCDSDLVRVLDITFSVL